MNKLKQDKYLLSALVLAFLNLIAVFAFFGFQTMSDSDGYIETIAWFAGSSGKIPALYRLLRPLGPVIAVPFEFLGQGAGLIVENIVFYFFSVFLVFKIIEMIFSNKKQALFSVILFITALPLLESGLSYLTDMGAWCFYLLSLFLTLLYFKNKNEKLIIINGFLSGLGVLMKENAGLGILFFGLMVLSYRDFSWEEKIKKLFIFGFFFLLPILIMQIIMYKAFRYTYIDWYLFNKRFYLNQQGGNLRLILAHLSGLYRALGPVGWVLALVGLFRELKEKISERMKIYLALIPSSFSFLIWPSADARTVFILAPLGLMFASRGLIYLESLFNRKKADVLIVAVILLAVILNYYFHLVGDYFPFMEINDFIRVIFKS